MLTSRFLRSLRFAALACLFASASVFGQSISVPPLSQTTAAGGSVTFSVGATGAAPLTYQWLRNGVTIAGATGSSLTIENVQPANVGIYTVVVTSGSSSARASAALGLLSSAKILGTADEIGPNIVHANGNVYDQMLLTGGAATITANPNQIVRISYLDLTDDIVQVEFSGAGALSLVIEAPSGPATPLNYNQSNVAYIKGHATIVVAGTDTTTNLTVFSVGSFTAVNQSLFKSGVDYDGFADLAAVAILSPSGTFGGLRTSNTSYFASTGVTGLLAPSIAFAGPVYIGEIDAFQSASPVLLVGSASDARITGGNLLQTNAQPIAVSGFTTLNFTSGITSHNEPLPALLNQGVLHQGGLDVTSAVAASGPTVVTISANQPATDESGSTHAEFTLTRTGVTLAPLSVSFGIGGSGTNGIDYPPLAGFATIPAGAKSVKIPLAPYPDTNIEATESVILTLVAGTGYTIGSASVATASISDSASTLYVATLRPASTAQTSAASGLATVVLSASGTTATVNVSFSNLSSGQTGAHLFLGNSTSAGDYVLNLPLGQVDGTTWVIQSTATYTATQIIDSLRNGLIYVGLDTAQYPAGELRGSFLSALGSQTFTPPAASPTVALTNITAVDATRLLTQATFGPRKTEIDALTGGSVDAWITAQMALPNSSHRTRTFTELEYVPITNNNNPNVPLPIHRQYAWFYNILQGPDQLRQRVAFALSQILVVSDASLGGQQYTEGLANYYDLLANGAFGNFRTLLEQVTLSPIMGSYLSHLRNAKADPVTGTNPDENYAREVMQLFSIGLVQLQPDGTLKLDEQGLPLPTYNQATITEMAKVFTGWAFFNATTNATNSLNLFRRGPADYINPMMIYAVAHETAAKNLSPVTSTVIPANLGGTEDLKRALDALFYHDNCGPFISRQLIQRLVTDNPSPAYVYRVAQKFADNGSGVRGDLGAVVRAILTDYEARSPAVVDDPGYGKLKEPLLRFTGILRSFNATSTAGHYTSGFGNVDTSLVQAALRSPSVFNFFEPGYVYPGALAAAGLVAPEFQITNDTTAISVPNAFRAQIFAAATGNNAANIVTLNLSTEQGLASNVPALLDHLAPLLANGQLSTTTRTRIATAMSSLNASTTPLERAQTAVLLVATSPEGATQK